MGLGMARHAQNVPKLTNRQYLRAGLSYFIDCFCKYLFFNESCKLIILFKIGVTRHDQSVSKQQIVNTSLQGCHI